MYLKKFLFLSGLLLLIALCGYAIFYSIESRYTFRVTESYVADDVRQHSETWPFTIQLTPKNHDPQREWSIPCTTPIEFTLTTTEPIHFFEERAILKAIGGLRYRKHHAIPRFTFPIGMEDAYYYYPFLKVTRGLLSYTYRGQTQTRALTVYQPRPHPDFEDALDGRITNFDPAALYGHE